MRLILARHGESDYSAGSLLNGDPDVACGLTVRGVEEARALGELLRFEPLELCVTSGFQRTEETADKALRGCEIARVVLPELGDPRYGPFEGKSLAEYRLWARHASSADSPGPGGESRREIVARYARAFRVLLARPEQSILVIAHSLPISYALGARDGIQPGPGAPIAEHARPYPFDGHELERATALLEDWTAAPTW